VLPGVLGGVPDRNKAKRNLTFTTEDLANWPLYARNWLGSTTFSDDEIELEGDLNLLIL